MNDNFIGYVYIIKCLINNKGYIGITNNIIRRWDKHISQARKGSPYALYCAMRKYGIENFSITILQTFSSKEELCNAEKLFIKTFNTHANGHCGYNETFGGEAPMMNKKHTKETRELMSRRQKGKPSPNKGKIASMYTRQLLSETHNKAVAQLDLNGNIIAIYQSVGAAGLAVNIAGSNISGVCRNRRKTAAGFRWSYYEETK